VANKTKLGPTEALALTKRVKKVIAAKGKKLETLDVATTDEAALLAVLIGPTGNLRAPAIVVGTTLIVGFSPEAYSAVLV
jgi:arsenate reductase-like glutaredoxin family protein